VHDFEVQFLQHGYQFSWMDGDVVGASIPPIQESVSHEEISLGVIIIRLDAVEITAWNNNSIQFT
jgi:hypothetical protein